MIITVHEVVHIEMPIVEADQLRNVLAQINSTGSNLPDWVKEQASKFTNQLAPYTVKR